MAGLLEEYRDRSRLLVLGLPRGGVPVAAEVARALGAPLDVFVVRKLGVPGREELAMGAIASGGVQVHNAEVIARLDISDDVIAAVAAREASELQRRELAYRSGRPPLEVPGRTVILVDDGLATGSTMRAAIAAVREKGPAAVMVAVPTAAEATLAALRSEADAVVAAVTPEPFIAVGHSYLDFSQTTDEEVRRLLLGPQTG
ncbi:MAG: phosphoribosyltransferase [Actinomycetota bacterium]|nr:phosphoribosyltransferase [Actinomycetota bacterium]